MRGLNLDHLQTFAEVVTLGSFTAAAKRLNLTQPAVSLQIRELERRLGVRLIERLGKRAAPTPAGRELLAHVRPIEIAVGAALEAMAFHATGAVGRVRLGSGATACIYLLPPILRRLRARFPSLEIVVRTGNTAEIVKAVEDNALDLALVTMPVSAPSLHVTPVLDDEIMALFPVDADLPQGPLPPSAFSGRPVVLYEPGASTRRVVDEWFLAAGMAIKPVMELGSCEAIKRLVGAGLGCSILPGTALAEKDARRRLIVRPLSPRSCRRLAVVLRRDKPLNPGLREVVAALSALAGP